MTAEDKGAVVVSVPRGRGTTAAAGASAVSERGPYRYPRHTSARWQPLSLGSLQNSTTSRQEVSGGDGDLRQLLLAVRQEHRQDHLQGEREEGGGERRENREAGPREHLRKPRPAATAPLHRAGEWRETAPAHVFTVRGNRRGKATCKRFGAANARMPVCGHPSPNTTAVTLKPNSCVRCVPPGPLRRHSVPNAGNDTVIITRLPWRLRLNISPRGIGRGSVQTAVSFQWRLRGPRAITPS
ncbi:hypothetical protein SKAU_G00335720 [Synaphobranchus kaupii]|uniref:Uncharacterized protein n=1 Tax=Synaphobranchus kaupii TaxID=118154 RepID=A0A9Q1IIY2_SYNKA|nr:hypothetical protein SKAU_G00335720 [Synaphobranchus kaupii]